ncbi:MAG: type II secretion system minor pseudopilin GspK [Betaproteobacteria bacterium]|nr:type II secretion system minor pseudopilin GspK [Betaproteobacteria bacterium]
MRHTGSGTAAAASRPEKGVAIVLAMGVAAMAAMAATAIMVTQSTWMRQRELSAGHAQAQVLVQTGLDWVRVVLSEDRRTTAVDHLGEPWALRLAPVPVEQGELAGYIEDQQGRFNLNNLVSGGKVSPSHLAQFKRLLAVLELPAELAEALADWIDADSEPQPLGGAESEYYLALDPPYLAANRPLVDASELALVRGFDDVVRARLGPFVTALPRSTLVNVNTAPAEVLAATIEGMDLDVARGLVAQRERAYFRSADDFISRLTRGLAVSPGNISVRSDYFLVTMRVTIGEAQARGTALLVRDGAAWPTVIWRKYL